MFCYIKFSQKQIDQYVLSRNLQPSISYPSSITIRRKSKSSRSSAKSLDKVKQGASSGVISKVSLNEQALKSSRTNYRLRKDKDSIHEIVKAKALKSAHSIKLIVDPTIEEKDVNLSLLLNTNCYKKIFVDYIYDKISLPKRALFDLADENGKLVNINNLRDNQKVRLVLKHKHTYTIVIYQKDVDGLQYTELNAMLAKISRSDVDFHTRFNKLHQHSSVTFNKLNGSKSSTSTRVKRVKSVSKKSV